MATTKRPRTAKSTTKSAKSRKTTSEAAVAKVSTQAIDIQDAIRTRAYELYQQRGAKHGNDLQDWLRAEVEVRKHFGVPAA